MIRKLICVFGKILFLLKKRKIPKKFERILFIRSGALGDVLMTTPLVRAVRKAYPKAHLAYLTGNWSRGVLLNNKNIDEIIGFNDPTITNKKILKIKKLINKIKNKKFDVCFVLDKAYQWGLFAFRCKIQFRIGFDRKGEGFANNLNVFFDGSKYELDYYLDLARLVNIRGIDDKMDLSISKENNNFADRIVKKLKTIKNKKIIGIAPGGAVNPGQKASLKRWPIESYKELIEKLISDGYAAILFGGKDDKELCETLKIKNVINLAGKTTIQQTAALMKKCELIITHDSGPMHIAAAINAKLIALFGPTPAKRFAPKNAVVIESKAKCCPSYDIYGKFRKCNKNCMETINVSRVYKSVKSSF